MRQSYHRQILIIVLLLVACGMWSCSISKETETNDGLPQLEELSGEPIDLSAFKGKTVFVNVWATWCAPCIKEMPSIESMQGQLAGQVEVFMASDEDPERIKEFAKSRNFQFHFVRIMNADQLQLEVLPATYIIDPEGKIAFFESGARKWDAPENIDLINNVSK